MSGVDASAVARVLGITTTHKRFGDGRVTFLPQRIAVVAQGSSAVSYSTAKKTILNANEAGATYGYGSPIHLIARELFPQYAPGVGGIPVDIFPLEDNGSGVAASGTITPSGTQTATKAYRFKINNILSEAFTVTAGDSVAVRIASAVAAINSVLHMPVIATDGTTVLNIASKWQGDSANAIYMEIVDSDGVSAAVDYGTTWTIVQVSGGDVNPDVDLALANVGNLWVTMVINAMEYNDTVSLGKFQVWGEPRWGTLFHKPAVVFTGNTVAAVATAYAPAAARPTDRVNAYLVNPGSKDLPFVVAAAQVAVIAPIANNRPGRNYSAQRCPSLTPGPASSEWDGNARQAASINGCSSVEVVDNVVQISDVFTFWKPTGEEPPAYRYVCDIVKITQAQFNLNLIFGSDEWAGAELIPDFEPTVSETAKRPKDAKLAARNAVRDLGLEAVLTNTKATNAAVTAEIVGPKRLKVKVPAQVVGNAQVLDVHLEWDFYFGAQTAA